MILFFRSIPFSFAVFWRFSIIFPFILIPAFVVIAGTALIFPPIAFFITLVVYNFCALVGMRAGIGAAGFGNGPDFLALIRWSLLFTLFHLFCSLFIGALGWAVVMLARLMGYDEMGNLFWVIFSNDWLAQLRAAPLLAGTFLFFWVTTTALWCMSLVPQASAAWASTTARTNSVHLFSGFGSGFFGLFLVSFLSTALIVWTRATEGMLRFFGRLIEWAYVEYMDYLELPPSLGELLPGLFYMLIWLWASCWVFGAAALAFVRYRQKLERRAMTGA